ncbi:MAG TPA: acyltransferase domain-containing protein [Kofleriaceae bacterium]
MTTALLFAGQGVAPPFVAASVLARAASRPLLEAASDAAHEDVAALLVRGGRALSRTEVLQPALVAACLCAAGGLAADGLVADFVAGHSLGELAAWAAGGFVAPTDAIAAAGVRGRLMAREAAAHPGGMLAVHGDALLAARAIDAAARATDAAARATDAAARAIDAAARAIDAVARTIDAAARATDAAARAIESATRASDAVVIAAENAPDETVLSGTDAGLAAAARAAAAEGAASTRLAVAGAWHSAAMAGAHAELLATLAAMPMSPPRAAFVANRTGDVAPADSIPAMLADQLVHPIRFTRLLATLAACGVDRFVIPGPGKLLRALVRKNLGDVRVEIL